MLMLELVKDKRQAAVLAMTADELLRTYERAVTSKQGAISFINAALIETLVHEGAGLAASADDLPTLRKLREYIAGIEILRLPTDLPDFEGLAKDIAAVYQRADVLHLGPVNPDFDPAAALAYREQREILLEAGVPSDREDLQTVHQELAVAGGGA
jgi:hypothetical protein